MLYKVAKSNSGLKREAGSDLDAELMQLMDGVEPVHLGKFLENGRNLLLMTHAMYSIRPHESFGAAGLGQGPKMAEEGRSPWV